MKGRCLRSYTQEFNQEAVRQVCVGQAIAGVAKALGKSKASLGNWAKLNIRDEFAGVQGDCKAGSGLRRPKHSSGCVQKKTALIDAYFGRCWTMGTN